MAKKKRPKKVRSEDKKTKGSLKAVLSLYGKFADLKKEISVTSEAGKQSEERLTDLEVHVNLLARLLTTLCLEKLGMQAGALRRLVRRIENEAVRDSQILELESLYKLSHGSSRKSSSAPAKSKNDPWEQIS